MAEDFVVARNPDPDSTLSYLVRVPLPGRPVVLKAREPWPRTSKVYCHRAEGWPEDVEVVERVPVRSCERRGGAIDLVLDRARENRSQFVMTRVRGREAIFWQSARTAKQARPAVRPPTARAAGLERFTVLVDAHERYPYRFAGQQVDVERRALPAGDYGVQLDGVLVAAVERKSLADLISSLTTGRLRFAMGELAALPRAAVVVEDRWSQVFKQQHVRPALVADGLAELAARYPAVPVFFAETRPLAEEWTYRWLAAALIAAEEERGGSARLDALVAVPDLPSVDVAQPPPGDHRGAPPVAVVRAWALAQGLPVSDRGRLRADVVAAYLAAQAPRRAAADDHAEGVVQPPTDADDLHLLHDHQG
ncbi:MAG: ERCC4 domain-containing protein [Motilibacteraceae bacterium]